MLIRDLLIEAFRRESSEQKELLEKFKKDYEKMAHTVIWLPDEVFDELNHCKNCLSDFASGVAHSEKVS